MEKNRLFSTKTNFADGSTFDYRNGYTPASTGAGKAETATPYEKPQGLTRGDKMMLWSFASVPVLFALIGGATMVAGASNDRAEAQENRNTAVENVLGELETRYGMEPMTHSENLDNMLVKVDGGLIMHCEATDHEHDGSHTAYVHCNGIADPVAVVNLDSGLDLE